MQKVNAEDTWKNRHFYIAAALQKIKISEMSPETSGP